MTDEAAERDWAPRTLYALGFLTLISTFNYLDRSLLGLALPDIKREMHASDTVLGLVSGLAFVLFYSILGIPIAWAADRFSRRNIIAIGFAFWSVMTMASGFVANIWQLALARFLMGAGEAAGMAPSTSLVSDLFRHARRPLAMSILGTASAVSGIVFFPVVGWIGQHHGWRWMFIVAGIPGLLLASIFIATVKEPTRGGGDRRTTAVGTATFRETIRTLVRTRSYLLMVAGATFMGANLFGAGAWTPTFLSRVHGMSLGEIASTIGPIRGVIGAIGILAGGVLIDRLGRGRPTWRVRIPAVACIIAGPSEALFLLGDPAYLWVTGLALSSFFTLVHQGPIFAQTVNVAPVPMRAVATAILLFSSALLGQVVGPLLVGYLNDVLHPEFGDHAVRYSLLVIAVTAVLGGCMFWLAGHYLEADTRRAAEG